MKKKKKNKGKKHHRYIDGRTNKQYYCKDCGRKTSINSGFYGKGRCVFCSRKIRNKSKKYRESISKIMKGHIVTEKTRRKMSKTWKRKYKKGEIIHFIKRNVKVKHHIDLDIDNNKKSNVLKLSQSRHAKMHSLAYKYLVETGQIKKYIKWFQKNYGLK